MHERTTSLTYTPDIAAITRKKRVAAYARVSSDRDEAFHSLSTQISYYQQIIADHPDWEFVEVFSDRGITGTKDNRPGFQALLSACREGKVDIVLAKSITRFARNTVILLETVRELKGLGIDIHFEEERINTLSATGELMISLLAARAQEEARSASENQRWRIKKSFEKGIPVAGNCLGYRLVDGQFLVEEEEEQTVLRIFTMYLSGMGCPAIAKTLRKEGVKNRLGNTNWSLRGIQKLIRNEHYCGDLLLQKTYRESYLTKKDIQNQGENPFYKVTDAHDPIIDRETFENTQAEIARRSVNKKHRLPTSYPFTGLIICGHCGKHFKRIQNSPGVNNRKPAWYCITSHQWGKDACSFTQAIPEHILMEKTCEVLGVTAMDEILLRDRIVSIEVPEKNELVYHLRDGTDKRVEWHHPSRRESWTPEMKEKARQLAIAWHKAKEDQRKEKT